MKDFFLKAKLTSPSTIAIKVSSPIAKEDHKDFLLRIDDREVQTLTVERTSHAGTHWHYDVKTHQPLHLGKSYEVIVEGFAAEALDVTNAIHFPTFDQDYFYPGQDLGASYHPTFTTFKVWAPLASAVQLKYTLNKTSFYGVLDRKEKGVFELTVQGDLEKAVYLYGVTNSGVTRWTPDPYAKGSTQNSEASVVVNPKAVDVPLFNERLKPFTQYTDAIIYETSIRDFTSDRNTSIVNKGRFLGMTESNMLSANGHPIGLDHLKKIGVTHVQLLPFYDFKTVDERDPNRFYNWGYDPMQYFVPEGSFASVLEDPYSRIIDAKKMIATLHQNGIRVVMDAVYNHVYNHHLSIFEKVVPDYYFRRTKEGRMSNGSFCGNDVASDRKMVQKMIVDSAVMWVKEYGVDGFRFDLMGIIDLETMKLLVSKVKQINPSFMFYGEGWNMPTELPEALRSRTENASQLPQLAFFNDVYRETVKGATFPDKITERGYGTGSLDHRLPFKYVYLGSALDLVFPAKFKTALQTINYVECHDNGTVFDKLALSNPEDDIIARLKRIKLLNAVVMLSFGIPFFHMGQEVGLSKQGDHNSYNTGDKINRFDYRILDERYEMVEYFAALSTLRKKHPFLRLYQPNDLESMVTFEDLPYGALRIDLRHPKWVKPFEQFTLVINPSKEKVFYDFGEYMTAYFNGTGFIKSGQTKVKNALIEPISLHIFVK